MKLIPLVSSAHCIINQIYSSLLIIVLKGFSLIWFLKSENIQSNASSGLENELIYSQTEFWFLFWHYVDHLVEIFQLGFASKLTPHLIYFTWIDIQEEASSPLHFENRFLLIISWHGKISGNPALRHGKPGSGAGFGYGFRFKSPFGHFQVDYVINGFQQKTVYFGITNLAS